MWHTTRTYLVLGTLLAIAVATNTLAGKEPYQDPTQPVEKRVADLLGRMTPAEKAGQLRQISVSRFQSDQLAQQLRTGQVGSLQNVPSNPALRNRMQRLAVEQAPHGIPLIFGFNSVHGYRTVFPIPLAMACSWEPALFEHTAEIAAREMAADGFDWTFAPMVDMTHDPRWGRIAEGYGEDPWLGAQFAAANVRGYQGPNPAARDHVVACLKHYVGYGAAEGGRDYNTVEVSDYTLRNFHLPPFRAGIDAGALTVMSAFHSHNGVPATGSRYLLTDVLRGELGFKGLVVSDWESVAELLRHGTVTDAAEAARVSLHAGVDMEKVSATYTNIPQLVAAGRLAQAEVDEAVRRVLRVKFQRGLFEQPYVDETLAKTGFLQPDALALAYEAAVKSCVLLKNSGVLPLHKEVKRIALIGPMGAEQDELLGCWPGRGEAKDVVSLAQGLRAALPDIKLDVVKGCELVEAPQSKRPAVVVEAAIAMAREADVILLAVGEPRSWSGEEGCRAELGLPGRQMELFEKVAATGKPVVVLLFSGRPLALPQVYARANAVLQVWQPGLQGGPALADLLLGKVAPSGRLTVSVPRGVGQVPLYYNHLNTGRPTMGLYKDMERGPQFPFGYGLTYTTFAYGPVKLSGTHVARDGKITATATVKNTGKNPSEEVVQLYIRALVSSAGARPIRELKGFQKIALAPGESRAVTFTLTPQELGYYDAQGRWLVEPGNYQVWIAPNAEAAQAVEFVME